MNTENNIPYFSPHSLSGISQGAPILLAFSGGADSSALLHLLAEDGKKNGFVVHAAHFHHGIRGDEADRDAEFCKSIAQKHGVPFYLGRADVPALAKENGNSIEAEAREQRYAFFENIMRKNGISVLVTAHHAEDNIESIMLHILRGSGVSGLCGMAECRELADGLLLVRPLLHAKKEDILSYCAQNNISFVTDSTNSDTNYTRNYIRSEITPKMRELQPNLVSVFERLAKSAHEADEYITAGAMEFIELECNEGISTEKLNKLPDAVKARVISLIYSEKFGATLERVHVDAVAELCERNVPHSSVSLPAKVTARIENGCIELVTNAKTEEAKCFTAPFCEGDTLACAGVNINIEKNPTQKAATGALVIDVACEHISADAHFRSRAEGDRIRAGKMNKKVKKLISEKKIPLSQRNKLPLLVSGGEILWIPSVAVCDRIKTAKIKGGEDFYRITVKFEN